MTAEPNFEWDAAKDRSNRAKHGVSFAQAQRAFFDPRRVIAEDLSHGGTERRYFCFGWVDGGVMTVRFTWRDGRIAFSGQATGARGRRFMTDKTVKYTAGEIGPVRVIADFLPAPDALVPRARTMSK